MKSRLAVAAINNAVGMRRAAGETVAGCIVHSDRGSQFRSRKAERALLDTINHLLQPIPESDYPRLRSLNSCLALLPEG